MSNEEVIERLDIIIKLLALNAFSDEFSQKDKIITLSKLGVPSKFIVDILGVSRNYVDVTLSYARRDGVI